LSVINTIKKAFAFLVIGLFSLTAASQSLSVGLIDYPPHINFDEEISKSPLYKYMNKMLTAQGFTVTFIKLPRKRASVELLKGRIDILMPIPLNDENIKTLTSPIFHSVPGLCFKKQNFIPILSATHRLDALTIGVPDNLSLVPALTDSSASLVYLKGENATSRGMEMTQRGRFDAFYHPSPVTVYHRKNPLYKELACSYFHGYSTPVYIAVTHTLPADVLTLINSAYQKALKEQSYEYYFASSK